MGQEIEPIITAKARYIREAGCDSLKFIPEDNCGGGGQLLPHTHDAQGSEPYPKMKQSSHEAPNSNYLY